MTDQMTWDGSTNCANYDDDAPCGVGGLHCADAITDWVNDLGGEARHYAGPDCASGCWYRGHENEPVIVITGPDGPIYVHPGDTVHDTGEWFEVEDSIDLDDYRTVEVPLFRVSAAGTGETT